MIFSIGGYAINYLISTKVGTDPRVFSVLLLVFALAVMLSTTAAAQKDQPKKADPQLKQLEVKGGAESLRQLLTGILIKNNSSYKLVDVKVVLGIWTGGDIMTEENFYLWKEITVATIDFMQPHSESRFTVSPGSYEIRYNYRKGGQTVSTKTDWTGVYAGRTTTVEINIPEH
jgi:hypothetical protein